MAAENFSTTEFAQNLGQVGTNGWDTIYAMKVPALNEALRAHFKNKGEDATLVADCNDGSINAIVRDWQIIHGSGSDFIKIAINFASGDADLINRSGTPFSYDLAGAYAVAEVKLGFHSIKTATTSAESTISRHELKVSMDRTAPAHAGNQQTSPAKGVSNPPEVPREIPLTAEVESVFNMVNRNGPCSDDRRNGRDLGGMLEDWLTQHPQLFEFVFLSIDVAEHPPADFAWIAPTYVTFAVADGTEEEEPVNKSQKDRSVEHSVFAIMAMTENRPHALLSATVPAGAIPTNSGVNAAFIISPNLFLNKLVQPHLHHVFGTTPDVFALSENGTSISNIQDIKLKLHMDGKMYNKHEEVDATIPDSQFCITLRGTELEQEFRTIDFIYGMDDELNVQMSLAASSSLGIDENGRFSMQMKPKPRQSLTASPRPDKVAREMVWGAVISMVATMVLSLGVEFMAMRYAAGAGRGIAQGVKTAAQEAETSVQTVEEVAENMIKEEGNVLVEEATAAAGGVSRTVSVAVSETSVSLSASVVESEVVTVAAKEISTGATWGLKDLLKMFMIKTLPMMIGNMAGQLYAQMSSLDMINVYYNQPEKVPELAEFGSKCIAPTVWTDTDNAKLICAGLNGAMIMGFAVTLGDKEA
jgi:hypothetical protein